MTAPQQQPPATPATPAAGSNKTTAASRRDFLKTGSAALGAGSVAALSSTAIGAAAHAAEESAAGTFFAGAAEMDISPPRGLTITHYVRKNIGVYDPIFTRALYLRDTDGTSIALITADLIGAGFTACDELRAKVKKEIGVDEVWFTASHTHAGRWLVSTPVEGREYTDELNWDEGPGYSIADRPGEKKWNAAVHAAMLEVCRRAKQKAVAVTLRTGRADAQVGYNRRITGKDGWTYMGVNREGPAVPWVNVLVAESKATDKPIAVLFEHAAHPVMVPHTSKLVSADFPGAAVARVHEKLGKDVVAMFGQGCGANINGFPLRVSHDKTDAAGHKLGDAVVKAIAESKPVTATKITLGVTETLLPTQPLPSAELVTKLMEKDKNNPARIKQLKKITAMREAGGTPPPRRFDVYGVMLGDDWCLVGLPYEIFSQMELWLDKAAPFKRTMAFSLTNGGRGYIGNDEGLAMGGNGGYEAGSLPNWGGHETMSPNLGPPAVGADGHIQKAIKDLWS